MTGINNIYVDVRVLSVASMYVLVYNRGIVQQLSLP
jgi:hypothetical protein